MSVALQQDHKAYDGVLLQEAIELHHRVPVVAPYFEYYGYDSLFSRSGGSQCDLDKLDAAGIKTFGIAVQNGGSPYYQVGPNEFELAGSDEWVRERTIRQFATKMKDIRRCKRVRIVETANDLNKDTDNDIIAVIPLVTCHRYLTDLKALDELFALGMRISHCAGGFCTKWCRAVPTVKVAGQVAPVFTEFGREIIERMNELGIVIDVAHMSDESTLAVADVSTKPIVDGHTSSATAVPHSRGHHDKALRRIAESGGVVGIHFADHMFTAKVWGAKYSVPGGKPQSEPRLWKYNRHLLATVSEPEERARLRKNREAQERFYRDHDISPDPTPPSFGERIATVADMADHIEYLVNVCGVEHVGLGGDVNGITADSWPEGIDHVGDLPVLTAELMHRGWSEDALTKFIGGNWLRVYRECLPQ